MVFFNHQTRRNAVKLTWQAIPNFAFKVNVQMLVRSTAYQPGSLQKLAQNIFDHYMKGKTFEVALQTYIDLCWTIDIVKVATIGVSAPINRSNTLMQAIAMIFAREAYLDYGQLGSIKELVKSAEDSSGLTSWFLPKLSTLRDNVTRAQQADWLAATLSVDPRFGDGALTLVQESAAEAGRQATEMIHELAVLRKYGVKSSFFQDGMLHDPLYAWVFMDFHDIGLFFSDWGEFRTSSSLAVAGLAERSSLTKIGVEPKESRQGMSWVRGVRLSFDAQAIMTIDSEGELDVSFGLELMPMRKFFVHRENEALYEFLRYAHALRLYDLVVPLVTVEKMPQPAVPKGTMERLKNLFSRKHLINPDLIVPRLRTLENVDDLVRELEIEVEQADKETAERAKRELVRHDVVYHVRRLPKGKHPTMEARERAAEYGIVLAENETFVRPHERGKGELQGRVHRAKARQR